jgi:uncharacterized glyoxalase superfamily protein PhnB
MSDHDPLTLMLTSRDMKKSLAFYRDMLGFEIEAAWPDEQNPRWANLTMGRQAIMLGAQMEPGSIDQMCGGDAAAAKHMKTLSAEFTKNRPGVGVVVYIQVEDVDRFHADLGKKGLRELPPPKTQFYGIRDFGLEDPDGYRFLFYSPVALASCGSCGMPMKDAKPGEMYCGYCSDSSGKLKPYETILEGTASGYFMAMQKMPREKALAAAREHLSKMPAWKARK